MKYSVLLFENVPDEKAWDILQEDMAFFRKKEDCSQIIVSAAPQWVLSLARNPGAKTLLVQKSENPYMALLNGLKAVAEENVVVCALKEKIHEKALKTVLDELSRYPAIWYSDNLQAFDTRLVMFSLQQAIERNLAISTYAQAVEDLALTPLFYVNNCE